MRYLLILTFQGKVHVHSAHRTQKDAEVWGKCKEHEGYSVQVVSIAPNTIGQLIECADLRLAPVDAITQDADKARIA